VGYWDTLVNANPNRVGGGWGGAYAAQYPTYEIVSPQYPYPSPYTLATEGYRRNELIYACINKRAKAVSEAPCLIYDDGGETREELPSHPLKRLLRKPNCSMTEEQFWQVSEINLLISGFSAWEKEYNNVGEPIALWPMRSDWCSFYRGDGKPLRAIRYQPYGLPFADVPIEKVLLFSYYDPIFPLLKALSPSAVALRTSEVDNSATNFLKLFWRSGASVSGLLKTAQSLGDAEATRIRNRWRETHGGSENWATNNIAVLGSGAEYQHVEQTFKEMDFSTLDARDEVRICMVFDVPPILIAAKVGMDASTLSNYREARQAFYEETVHPEWQYMASEVREQLVRDFEPEPERFWVGFDTSEVKALQEDKVAVWMRAQGAWEKSLLTRDESREEVGYDPIDNAPVWYADVAAPAQGFGGLSLGGPAPAIAAEPAQVIADASGQFEPADLLAQEAEAKQFRAFAAKRIKEGRPEKVSSFKFKCLPMARAMQLIAEAQPASDTGNRFPEWESYG
jgi:HK97 family phage portal protein